MTKNIKNMAKSVKDRLKNIARDEGINFNQILLLYFHERLLYRLSVSDYSSNFLLKGGVLILSTTSFKTRPTKDIDFLAKAISNKPADIKNTFQLISKIDCNDGVSFDKESIIADTINSYLRKIGKDKIDFAVIMERIEKFLAPIYQAIIREDEFFEFWDYENKQWSTSKK